MKLVDKFILFNAVTSADDPIVVAIPLGHTVLLVHDLTIGTGHVVLSNLGRDGSLAAHQGGADAVNVKSTTQSTSYSSCLHHCSENVSIQLNIATGTHTVSMYVFEN